MSGIFTKEDGTLPLSWKTARRKLTSGMLAAALALASIGMQSRPARAEELEGKRYVIVAETDAAYEQAVEAALENEEGCGLLDVGYAMEQYEEGAPNEEALTENTEEPERFDDIEEDEGYVEGRWGSGVHQSLIGNSMGTTFTNEEIEWLKTGAALPDTRWTSGDSNSNKPWHGRWAYRVFQEDPRSDFRINYAAAVDMITTIALKGGDVSSFTRPGQFDGMGSFVFSDLREDIHNWYLAKQGYTNRKRKFVLFGCGIHALTDAFAHSTTKENGTLIEHPDADNIERYSRRHKAAARAAAWALYSLSIGTSADGMDILFALDETYTSDTSYRLINVKRYVVENGYGGHNDALLNRANIDFAVN